eukprot:TRINITY_DN3843_c0_g1_i1.p1 TRINITY_DN3843_c0_g1~~TRINITY_DN3843_c0_g1_i1.p1  ORF type:complete len:731 (-),score=127.97 TRINITY_DN3843_c0_g1_i1:53-2245(-)
MAWRRTKRLLVGGTFLGASAVAGRYIYNQYYNTSNPRSLYTDQGDSGLRNNPELQDGQDKSSRSRYPKPKYEGLLPKRQELLQNLKKRDHEYDLLVIGGGATGTGVALDAATRGLNVALVEKDDFSSGTSSKSTKLIHGGVRYLEKAFKNLDWKQYQMVRQALQERSTLLHIAPHITYALPIMLPIFKWWQVPYFYVGTKMYDLLAGSQSLQSSYFLTRTQTLEKFPWLRADKLVGAMVFYDGAHNDARTGISLALTAASYGADIANHVSVLSLIHNKENNRVSGARVRDNLTGEEWTIRAKGVINATGPFVDEIRKMDTGSDTVEIVCPSTGTHVVLPDYYSPHDMGLLDPSTSDGRVIFFLPWENYTISGTTDTAIDKVVDDPVPLESEISFILGEIRHYLSDEIQVRRSDVLSAWSGIRPLVRDPSKADTQNLVRNHLLLVSENKLLTIAGGKWTTYREMAEDTVDKAVQEFNFDATKAGKSRNLRKCKTSKTLLYGAKDWSPTLFIKLIQEYGLETKLAQHIAKNYGDKSWILAQRIVEGKNKRAAKPLAPGIDNVEEEVRWAAREEYAERVRDVIGRRMRIGFLDVNKCYQVSEKVLEIMAQEKGWGQGRKEEERLLVKNWLEGMGLNVVKNAAVPHKAEEIEEMDEKTEAGRSRIDERRRRQIEKGGKRDSRRKQGEEEVDADRNRDMNKKRKKRTKEQGRGEEGPGKKRGSGEKLPTTRSQGY